MVNPVDVKWFTSSMAGAPTMSGEAGKLISILDACLVSGFGSVTLDSISISSGVATATKTNHGFIDWAVVRIAGSTPSELNGDKRITIIDSNQFSFDATGLSDQTATGTITAKMSPLDWEKTYAGTGLAAYSRTNPISTAMKVRIDDTLTTAARFRMYESMSDVNTGIDPTPLDSQVNGGLYISKSSTSDTAIRKWIIVGDSLFVWIGIQWNSGYTSGYTMSHFGDPVFMLANNPFGCLIGGSYDVYGSVHAFLFNSIATQNSLWVCRSKYSQAKSVNGSMIAYGYNGYGGASTGPIEPNQDGKINVCRPIFIESNISSATSVARSIMPGAYAPFGNVSVQASSIVRSNNDPLMRFISITPTHNQSKSCFIDITGPWR